MSRSLTHLHLHQLCCHDGHYDANRCTCRSMSEEDVAFQWHRVGRSRCFPTEALPEYLPEARSPPLEHEHLVQYHTYHPCETKCNLCELYVWRVQFPMGGRSELGYAPREVCDRGDNTDLLGAPQACFRDVVIHGRLPVLHESVPAVAAACDCSEIEETTVAGGGAYSSTPGGWKRHGHWQIITEHHHCVVCVDRCTVTWPGTPTPVAAYSILSARGFQPRRGWGTFVRTQATQTEESFFPSLEQATLCSRVQSIPPLESPYPLPFPPESFRFRTYLTPAQDPGDHGKECEWREDWPATPYRVFADTPALRGGQ